jgi:hypothetical protein
MEGVEEGVEQESGCRNRDPADSPNARCPEVLVAHQIVRSPRSVTVPHRRVLTPGDADTGSWVLSHPSRSASRSPITERRLLPGRLGQRHSDGSRQPTVGRRAVGSTRWTRPTRSVRPAHLARREGLTAAVAHVRRFRTSRRCLVMGAGRARAPPRTASRTMAPWAPHTPCGGSS